MLTKKSLFRITVLVLQMYILMITSGMLFSSDIVYKTFIFQLEIMHGVLNAVEDSRTRSFFYMREPVEDGDKVS